MNAQTRKIFQCSPHLRRPRNNLHLPVCVTPRKLTQKRKGMKIFLTFNEELCDVNIQVQNGEEVEAATMYQQVVR